MKKTVLFAIAALIAGTVFGQENAAQNMRKVKLENADFAIPAENGVVGWSCHNRDWPGKLEVKDDENGGKYLSVTPLKSPTQVDAKKEPKVAAFVYGGTKFNAAAGDKLVIKFQVRVSPETSGSPVLDDGCFSQWLPSFKAVRAVAGQWCDYSVEYTIRETKNKLKNGKYSLGFLIDRGAVDIRPISLSIRPGSK